MAAIAASHYILFSSCGADVVDILSVYFHEMKTMSGGEAKCTMRNDIKNMALHSYRAHICMPIK